MTGYHLPPPRGDRALRDSLVEALAAWPGTILRWDAIVVDGYGTWLGAALPDLGWRKRPWGLDITGPGESGGDPLALEVERDLVAVTVFDAQRPLVRGRMVADLPAGLDEIRVPSRVWPPAPWEVDVDVGWSQGTVSDAVADWIARRVGRKDILVIADGDVDGDHGGGTVPVGRLVQATDVAFGNLLGMDPGDAAIICSVFSAVADALAG